MPVRVFDRIEAISTTPARTPLPAPLERLLAAAGVAPGGKIPIAKIDAAFAKMDLSIKQRLKLKAELKHLGMIAP
jgi:hypothetical protein